MASKNDQIKELVKLANQFEGKLAGAFVSGVNQLKDTLVLKRIAEFLQSGNPEAAIALLTEQLFLAGFSGLSNQIRFAFEAGATAGVSFALSSPAKIVIGFNVLNPETANFLRNHQLFLIRQINNETRGVLRDVISASTIAGNNPLTTARLMRDSIGLTRSQIQSVENFRRLLSDLNPSALDRQLRDRRFDSTVRTAIADQKKLSQEKINQMTERYRERLLILRSKTIGRTEAIRAVNAGNHRLWLQAVNEGLVPADNIKRFWIVTQDEKLRSAHEAIPEMNEQGVGIEEPFDTPLGPLMFPADPSGLPENTINCRCTVFTRIVEQL